MPEVVVACNGLHKCYGRHIALQALSLAINRGEVFGLVGANGGSKTTVLRLLAGLLEPDRGTCHVLGSKPSAVRHRIGYMSQALGLYGELTVRENLCLRAALFDVSTPRAAAATAIDRFGLVDHANIRVGRLSGGWARRAQLAASLIHAPDLVLLDEPTVGLDVSARQQVWAQILGLAEHGATVVVATHDLAEAERFSRLIFLARGRALASGTPTEIVAQADVRTFLMHGRQCRALQLSARQLEGIVSTYPHGSMLRVVVRSGGATAVHRLARDFGMLPVAAAATLDDAAHALMAQSA